MEDVQRHRLAAACSFARENGVTLVLKGAGTIVAAPDGRAWINLTGNAGMAKGGSGDVLAGMIGSLLAQGCAPEEARCGGRLAPRHSRGSLCRALFAGGHASHGSH